MGTLGAIASIIVGGVIAGVTVVGVVTHTVNSPAETTVISPVSQPQYGATK
ncbi:hypothetical protein [Nocardioides sp.]|uniref:hypothetical protein n=1 Tax=Nocardioides sp. TaxID=35761 RepID=UPI0039E2CE96